jgi:hypothetical protein
MESICGMFYLTNPTNERKAEGDYSSFSVKLRPVVYRHETLPIRVHLHDEMPFLAKFLALPELP